MIEIDDYTGWVFETLHRLPEPGLQEFETARFLAGELERFGYEVTSGVGETGIVATMESGVAGPVLGVRADMDALPFEVGGKIEHIHACGHDANCTMVLAAARAVAARGIARGKLKIIFQPAEETFLGARQMVASRLLDDLEELVGIHLRPAQELGFGRAVAAVYHAAAYRIRALVKGRPAHSAKPHLGINTIDAAALAVNAVNALRLDPLVPHSAKATTIRSLGTAHNIIPDRTEVVFDLRAQRNETMDELIQKVKNAVTGSVGTLGAEVEMEDIGGVPAAVYDPQIIATAEAAIAEVLGEADAPIINPGSEDFHVFTLTYGLKSAYLGIGADLKPGLHDPQMSFDHQALHHGRQILEKVVAKRLGQAG